MATLVTGNHAGAQADVALIGYGKMGRPMGRRLLASGYRLTTHDLEPVALQAASDDGAAVAASSFEAALNADFVITMLPDAQATMAASHGEKGILSGLRPGALWIEMTSSHPAITRELAQAAEKRGAALLDAPVSGGVVGAEAGRLAIFVGGTAEQLERARPVLDVLGRNLFHVGDRAGDGDLAKTINNLLSAVNLTAAAEALTIGVRGGLEPARLVAAIASGSGSSQALETKIPTFVLTGTYNAGFTINQMLKDLRIGQEVVADLGVPLSVGSIVYDMWTSAADEDHGEEDHTMMTAHIAARAGVDLTPRTSRH